MKFVDAHLHVWDPAARRHAWLDDEPRLRHAFGPEDVDTGRHELEAAVFVQADCRDTEALDEVRWVQQLADEHPFLCGIVAYAPVHLGRDVAPHLAALADEPLVVGVRRLIQGAPVPPQLATGAALLPEWNLTFDLCVTHDQLPAVAELVEACPATTFVLDHLGKPPVAEGRLDPWRDDLARLAAFPNVSCKLSGLATEAAPGWTSGDVRPYLAHALEVFGAARCMIGTDWPLVTLAGTIERWVDAVLDVVPPDDQDAVLCETATSIYGLRR
jgi:L-fuconolactonase